MCWSKTWPTFHRIKCKNLTPMINVEEMTSTACKEILLIADLQRNASSPCSEDALEGSDQPPSWKLDRIKTSSSSHGMWALAGLERLTFTKTFCIDLSSNRLCFCHKFLVCSNSRVWGKLYPVQEDLFCTFREVDLRSFFFFLHGLLLFMFL